MALPDNELSSTAISGDFIGGRAQTLEINEDFETGGIGLNDNSQGLLFQVWRTFIVGRFDVYIEAPNTSATLIYQGVIDVTEVSATFDQNMRVTLAFVEGDNAKLQWFDTSVGMQVVTDFGSTVGSPRVSLDDKRSGFVSNSDIIFSYIKDGNLYYRQQRDRYETERLLASDVLPTPESYLRRTGMSSANRFQFEIFDPWSLEEQLAYTLSQADDASATFTNPIPTVVPTIITPSSPTIWDQDNEDE